jgi:hypothetical protein
MGHSVGNKPQDLFTEQVYDFRQLGAVSPEELESANGVHHSGGLDVCNGADTEGGFGSRPPTRAINRV